MPSSNHNVGTFYPKRYTTTSTHAYVSQHTTFEHSTRTHTHTQNTYAHTRTQNTHAKNTYAHTHAHTYTHAQPNTRTPRIHTTFISKLAADLVDSVQTTNHQLLRCRKSCEVDFTTTSILLLVLVVLVLVLAPHLSLLLLDVAPTISNGSPPAAYQRAVGIQEGV
jgi:hypothetical protein